MDILNPPLTWINGICYRRYGAPSCEDYDVARHDGAYEDTPGAYDEDDGKTEHI